MARLRDQDGSHFGDGPGRGSGTLQTSVWHPLSRNAEPFRIAHTASALCRRPRREDDVAGGLGTRNLPTGFGCCCAHVIQRQDF